MSRCAVLLLAVMSVAFAPAPFPHSLAAEAVLAAPTVEEAKRLSRKFTSAELLARVLGSNRPDSWRRASVSVELAAGGKRVRVRIYRCPPADAVKLLQAMVTLGRRLDEPERRAARARLEEAQEKYRIMCRLLTAAPPGAISREEIISARDAMRKYAKQLEGAEVVQQPGLVKRR